MHACIQMSLDDGRHEWQVGSWAVKLAVVKKVAVVKKYDLSGGVDVLGSYVIFNLHFSQLKCYQFMSSFHKNIFSSLNHFSPATLADI